MCCLVLNTIQTPGEPEKPLLLPFFLSYYFICSSLQHRLVWINISLVRGQLEHPYIRVYIKLLARTKTCFSQFCRYRSLLCMYILKLYYLLFTSSYHSSSPPIGKCPIKTSKMCSTTPFRNSFNISTLPCKEAKVLVSDHTSLLSVRLHSIFYHVHVHNF